MSTLSRVARPLALVVLAALFLLPSGCSAGAQKPRPTHQGVGTVVAVSLEKSRVKIDHEKIEGYMEPMTMWFDVKDASLLQGIAPNDRVEFTVTEEEAADVITALRKIG